MMHLCARAWGLGLTSLLLAMALLASAGPVALADDIAGVTETPTPVISETPTPEPATPTPSAGTATPTADLGTATPTAVVTTIATASAVPTNPPPANTPAPTSPPASGGTGGVRLVKSADANRIEPGGVINYALTVFNDNAFEIRDVVVNDVLDPRLDFIGGASAVNVATFDSASRTVSWSVGTIPAQSNAVVTLRVRVNSTAVGGDTIPNVGVSLLTSTDSNVSLTSNQVDIVIVPDQAPDLGAGPGPREMLPVAIISALLVLAWFNASAFAYVMLRWKNRD
jgi:uncharacterized repeat protein (TIGR01451 family)